MVEEKKVFKILYEAFLEIYSVDEEGYNYWKDNEPSDKEFIKAVKRDLKEILVREDSNLTQLNYWTSDLKVKRLSVDRIKEYPKK